MTTKISNRVQNDEISKTPVELYIIKKKLFKWF